MALQLKQSLNLTQQLIMTPQLQQAIKLLQLSRLELLETITQEMETNPVLEDPPSEEYEAPEEPALPEPLNSQTETGEIPGDERDWESYVAEYNSGWNESGFEHRETPPFESVIPTKGDLYSHLTFQLDMSHFTERQKQVGISIIGNLDEDGYLKASPEEIAESIGCSVEEVLETLQLIQNFDPVGVAARD